MGAQDALGGQTRARPKNPLPSSQRGVGLNPDSAAHQLCVPRGRLNLSDHSPHLPCCCKWWARQVWHTVGYTGVYSSWHLSAGHPLACRPGGLEGVTAAPSSPASWGPFSGLTPLLPPSLLLPTPPQAQPPAQHPDPPPEPPSLPSRWGFLNLLTPQISNPPPAVPMPTPSSLQGAPNSGRTSVSFKIEQGPSSFPCSLKPDPFPRYPAWGSPWSFCQFSSQCLPSAVPCLPSSSLRGLAEARGHPRLLARHSHTPPWLGPG